MRQEAETPTPIREAAYSLSSGLHKVLSIAAPSDGEMESALAGLIAAAGTARLSEMFDEDYELEDAETFASVAGSDLTSLVLEWWSWIPSTFRYFYERDYTLTEAAMEQLTSAVDELKSSRMAALLSVGSAVDDWHGDARDAFRDSWLGPLEYSGIGAQQSLLLELHAAMLAYDAILRQARIDAREIAVEAVKVLDSLTESNPDEAKVLLGIAGVAVAVVTAVQTGGTSIGITLGLLGAGLAASTTAIDAVNLSGDTSDDVMASVKAAFDALKNEMLAQERAIAEALARTQEEVDGDLRRGGGNLLPTEVYKPGTVDLTTGAVPPSDQFQR
ncbi:hypothetical protein Afil01_19410 [Actinorhabdospora filicis]|uniref:Uncharacterized protein n=1 Tax=Actinorhabdospora filicis TaxID=1785913 RepID=A0A9W6W820_9ACTN|nr:hypothetical protein [Actinorhabdospora filicis]GLZ77134.1 hypothetical protein Afil01_19410 [Actinorhabdospora filicis]